MAEFYLEIKYEDVIVYPSQASACHSGRTKIIALKKYYAGIVHNTDQISTM